MRHEEENKISPIKEATRGAKKERIPVKKMKEKAVIMEEFRQRKRVLDVEEEQLREIMGKVKIEIEQQKRVIIE